MSFANWRDRKLKSRRMRVAAAVLLAATCAAARADPIEDFYKGRQIRFVIGSNSGGSYDSYGRLAAQHLARHIPGNPTIVAANMPGASGMQSAAYLYQIAPKDGSVLGMFNQSMAQRQMLEPDSIRFDAGKFNWLGAMAAARNFALEQASGEWILYIDADERLEIPSRDAYSKVLSERGKVAWQLRLHPRVGWTAYSELRLFRNDPRIRFQGVIHENPWPSVEAVACADRLEVGICDVRLYHIGYEADQRPKNPRNISLLRDCLARDPNHFFSWWHLGECLRLAGDEDAADDAWSSGIVRLRALDPEHRRLSHSLLYLALLKLRHTRGAAVDDLLADAMASFPSNLALQWMSAQLAVDRGDLESARPVLERLAAIDSDSFFEPELSYDKALFGHLSAELLALCHFRGGRFDDAARLYRVAAASSPLPAACELKARFARLRASGSLLLP